MTIDQALVLLKQAKEEIGGDARLILSHVDAEIDMAIQDDGKPFPDSKYVEVFAK